jgi:hypothetical protein
MDDAAGRKENWPGLTVAVSGKLLILGRYRH